MQLNEIKGIGEKRLRKLAEANISTPLDLLLHFPYAYADTDCIYDWKTLQDGDVILIKGRVDGPPVQKFVRKGLSFVKCKFCLDSGETVSCTWFNQRFVFRQLLPDSYFFVRGKVKKFRGGIEISAPQLLPFEGNEHRIIPLYRPIKGLPSNVFSEAVRQVLLQVRVNSYLSPELAAKHHLMPLNEAFRCLHCPKNMAEVSLAARTVAIENVTNRLALFSILKRQNAQNRIFRYSEDTTVLQDVIKTLPYALTNDQQNALDAIMQALRAPRQMNLLLQGDVGCGKTIVALLAMYFAYRSGYQSVLMAPTELLARQHYKNALQVFSGTDVKIALLTGAQSKTERDTVLFNIRNGVADLVIGTHAVIQDNVTFKRLSLVITDEQHRFGVNQRGDLENKASGTDCLVMSATPIPRTLALTMYGELEQVKIASAPQNKAKIITKMVPQKKLQDMYAYIGQKAAVGEQTYLVCPRIEEDEDGLLSVTELYNAVKSRYAAYGVGLLHGQLKESAKNAIMQQFAEGQIRILITTTVIEVGIDVRNATNMVIFHAERYGLSQLHQLRGRVGRGTAQSYCFLVTQNEQKETLERLQMFCECDNGFTLAEYDFKLRGAGDFIGTRQHGENSVLSLVTVDAEIIHAAKEIAEQFLQDAELCEKLTADIGESGCEYIKSITLN